MNNTLKQELNGFYGGTENYYKYPLSNKLIYTDGVKYLAEKAQAYWLIDKIATNWLYNKKFRDQHMVVLHINVHDDTALLTYEDGNHNKLYEERVEYTDFPLDTFSIWLIDNVILLPSEY